ncbi:DUF3179 domain-containing protein [Candidatus Dojkabacteria bacterium]|uniref:DUF3179 domain-containing protein n=1 Tax=Candidatus Dojkabacteria bacterium TaxID=2099670 RepID=A0A955RKB7_9BACT|nr:DUF3179 domain-containing protein [Candidatus Dojkabacteria bacterium]
MPKPSSKTTKKEPGSLHNHISVSPVIIIGLILAIAGVILIMMYVYLQNRNVINQQEVVPEVLEQVKDDPFRLENKYMTVDMAELKQACPYIDCIPSIDRPIFETAEESNEWLTDDEIIFGLERNGVVRAYPQKILNWHEIVNDSLGSDPIAITFCPLCGTALAYERIVNGDEVEFGVTGKLYNSVLVMYDRTEENYWSQLTGQAIAGPAAQRMDEITQIELATTTWGEWKSEHPESEVLSKETGYTRTYDIYPYDDYESSSDIWFSVMNRDERLHPKHIVYGVKIGEETKAYPIESFDSVSEITDTIGGIEYTLIREEDGHILATSASGQEIMPIRVFWFAWAAFYPETGIYQQ